MAAETEQRKKALIVVKSEPLNDKTLEHAMWYVIPSDQEGSEFHVPRSLSHYAILKGLTKQPSNKTLTKYPELLRSNGLGNNRVRDSYAFKQTSIESLQELIREIERPYWSKNKKAPLQKLAKQRTSMTGLENISTPVSSLRSREKVNPSK